MPGDQRIDLVFQIVEKATSRRRYSLRRLAREFEELEPSWFLSRDHVRRLYGFLAHIVFGREYLPRFRTVRAGDYVVVYPSPRDEGALHHASAVFQDLAEAAFYAWWGPASLPEAVAFKYMERISEDPRPWGIIYDIWIDAPLTGAYSFYGRRSASSRPTEEVLTTPECAVVGVDSDTGKIFVKTLPWGAGALAILLHHELGSGDDLAVRAVRALLGYDHEVSGGGGSLGVTRLQGDLYVRVDALGLKDPGLEARRIIASWTAAGYIIETVQGIIDEAVRSYARLIGPWREERSQTFSLKAGIIALEESLIRVHPWLYEKEPCVSGAVSCIDRLEYILREVRFYPVSPRPGTGWLEDAQMVHSVIDVVDDEELFGPTPAIVLPVPKSGEWKLECEKCHGIDTAVSNPLWAMAAQLLMSLPFPQEGYSIRTYLDEREVVEYAETYLTPLMLSEELASLLSRLVPGATNTPRASVALLELLAAHAAHGAVESLPAPQRVKEAVADVEPVVVESRIGDHRVWAEGYLITGVAARGVALAEVASDLGELARVIMKAREALGFREESTSRSFRRTLFRLALSRKKTVSKLRLEAARYMARLLYAKQESLTIITPGPTVIEAEHPEHGRARLELEEPALVTIATNPAVDFDNVVRYVRFNYGDEALPSYLREEFELPIP